MIDAGRALGSITAAWGPAFHLQESPGGAWDTCSFMATKLQQSSSIVDWTPLLIMLATAYYQDWYRLMCAEMHQRIATRTPA